VPALHPVTTTSRNPLVAALLCLVVRASQAQDPYQADGTDKSLLLQRVRSLWTAGNPMGTTHEQVFRVRYQP